MENLNVIDINSGKVLESIEIPENLKKYFDYKNPQYLIHEVVTAYLNNQRQATHSTKTRAEVRGGGRKPWVQKHTGRARQGTIRSPLWRKGGVVFGPKPRDYYINIPKKKKTIAKYLCIVDKIKSGDLIVVKNFNLESHKTKEAKKVLKNINLDSEKILVVDKQFHQNTKLATRNLQNVSLKSLQELNAYNVLNTKKIIFTKEALLCL